MTVYAEWQQRVVAERDSLAEKVTKLGVFISSETYKALDMGERFRMSTQLHHMTGYMRTLEERIANFVKKENP